MKTKEEFSIMLPDKNYATTRFNRSERHEIYFGGRNRQKSIEDGMIVFLTPEQHRGTYGVHGKHGREFDMYLEEKGQQIWMDFYNKTVEDFIKRYGRNYLD